MRLATTAALIVTALALAACDNKDLERAIATLTGDLDEMHDREADLRSSFERLQDAPADDTTEAEMDELRKQYAALALRLESVGAQPGLSLEEPAAEPAVLNPPVTKPEPSSEEPIPEPTPPPFECVSIFRVQTCEEGVLYMLDDQMGWILPGRTE